MATKRLTNVAQHIHDVAIRYQVYLERLKSGEVAKFDDVLIQLDRQIRAVLSRVGDGKLSSIGQVQLRTLLADVAAQVNQTTNKYTATLNTDLKAVSQYAAEFEARTLAIVVAENTIKKVTTAAFTRAATTPIEATGDLLADFIKGWQNSVVKNVNGAIRVGYSQGQTTAQIVTKIRGTKSAGYKDGILTGKTRRETAAMVRTAVQHVSAQAREATWDANKDIVSGYTWVSTLDSRTTQICKSLDGRVFKVGAGPTPPIHIGCRSVTVANIDGVDVLSLTQRASKGAKGGKAVAADLTYYEWLKTQPSDFQDDALGPTRGELFRKGGLSADDFAKLNLDKNFKPMTLEEMRKKEPAAFRRAGL
jgi:SPP1 gp7 family putative phage head morphogenesis protein